MILILLTILKIIGIILLVLLGLIILLLCLLLFAPVKYRAKGAKHPDALSVSAFVSYLWPLVRVRVEYPSETILSVKILWIDLLHPKEKNRTKKKRKKIVPEEKRDNPQNNESGAAKPMRTVPETPVYRMDILPNDYEEKDVQVQLIREETADEEKNNPEQFSDRSEKPDLSEQKQNIKPGQSERKRDTNKETDKSNRKKATKKSATKKKAAPHTEKKSENKLAAIVTLLWQYKEMYPDVLGRIFHALKSILPRKCNIHLIFGTGSPDNTGYLYGAYCALQEYLPGTIVFEPVWMESYLDVEFELNGNIRLIHFVTAAVKIIADKRVRNFIAEIRRL